jgi:organic anion transporter 5A
MPECGNSGMSEFWMVGWLDGWMVGWLDDWMVGWLDDWIRVVPLDAG